MRSQNEHGRWSPHRWIPSMWVGLTGYALTVGNEDGLLRATGFACALLLCGLSLLVTFTSHD